MGSPADCADKDWLAFVFIFVFRGFVVSRSRQTSDLIVHSVGDGGLEQRLIGERRVKYGRRKTGTGEEDMKVLVDCSDNMEQEKGHAEEEKNLD